jgi:hypothetical protein
MRGQFTRTHHKSLQRWPVRLRDRWRHSELLRAFVFGGALWVAFMALLIMVLCF